MLLSRNLVFLVDRISDTFQMLFTDTTDYDVAGVVKGFYRIEYPDGIIVENTDMDNPDFTDLSETSTIPLRLKKLKPITGNYAITQKIYIDDVLYSSLFSVSFSFIEPQLIVEDKSNATTPIVAFFDATDYSSIYYTNVKTRTLSSYFPATSNIPGVQKSTLTNYLDMDFSDNYYEGIYTPLLNVDALYTSDDHAVRWLSEKSFSFDVRKFVGYANLVEIINVFKASVRTGRDEQTYQMIMSLYSHLIAKIEAGETDIGLLVNEILELATGGCGCDAYTYQPGPIVVDSPESAVIHNRLNGLQGGNVELDEFFHLPEDEHDAAVNATSPSAENPFLTVSDVADRLLLKDVPIAWEFDGNKVYTITGAFYLHQVNGIFLYGVRLRKDGLAYQEDPNAGTNGTITLGDLTNPSIGDLIELDLKMIEL